MEFKVVALNFDTTLLWVLSKIVDSFYRRADLE